MINLGSYVSKNSIIHRCDARIKLFAFIAYVLFVFLIPSWVALGVEFMVLLALCALAHLNIVDLAKSVLPIIVAFVIVSAGELNKNKNTQVIVRALKDVPEAHYVACGVGPEEKNLLALAKALGVEDRFHLLGYRTDMPEILAAADVFTIMSFREGMPRALLEAMDMGLPCVQQYPGHPGPDR